MWVEWRYKVEKSTWMTDVSKAEVVDELAEFMGYCSEVLGNMESTTREKLVAVNFFPPAVRKRDATVEQPVLRRVR